MGTSRDVQTYAYVNHPYNVVRDSLGANPLAIFHKATSSVAKRASVLVSTLRVELFGLEVGVGVDILVDGISETDANTREAVTHIRLRWQASKSPLLFPFMVADLAIYPLSSGETQIDFRGSYTLPLGIVGSTLDSIAGHRIAEESVQRFVNDVAEHLKRAPVLMALAG